MMQVLQADYYHLRHSPCSAHQWAAGLVTALLSVMHSQWLHCNSILHAWDADGLRTWDAHALQEAMDQQFQTGLEGLHLWDYHLIEHGQEMVQRMLGSSHQAWLESIHVA